MYSYLHFCFKVNFLFTYIHYDIFIIAIIGMIISTWLSINNKQSESEVKVKWKWKWSEWVFGPLNLFIFGYVKGGVLGNNNIGIKKCTTFLWVLNFRANYCSMRHRWLPFHWHTWFQWRLINCYAVHFVTWGIPLPVGSSGSNHCILSNTYICEWGFLLKAASSVEYGVRSCM